uniref:C-type lectin domain-containing protein n=1 Tax=Monopterus albus TaxID=43700 RepID=A0A3Q3IRJ0_MONAL
MNTTECTAAQYIVGYVNECLICIKISVLNNFFLLLSIVSPLSVCFLFKGKSNEFRANWSYARSWCREQGGDLAVIDNQYENGKELHYPTWIGLSDLVEENQYAWSDGVSPVLYTNWNENEPNNAGGTNEGCVSMHASPVFHGTWNDTKCDQAKPYICKITFGTSHTD